jgi:two-component system, chemotaxis family, sensor kinase CheA
VNFQAVIEELQELGQCEFIIHNETIPFETQIVNKEIVSWFEVILVTRAGMEGVQDVFMFMKPSEYTIIEIASRDVFEKADYKVFISLSAKEVEHRIKFVQSLIPDFFENAGAESVEETLEIEDAQETTDAVVETSGNIIRRSKKGGHVSVSTVKCQCFHCKA